MKHLLLSIVFIFGLKTSVVGQEKTDNGAWEIISKVYLTAEEHASHEELKDLEEKNRKMKNVRIRELISHSTYNSFESTLESGSTIINKEGVDFYLYTIDSEDNFAVKMPYEAYLKDYKNSSQSGFYVANLKKTSKLKNKILSRGVEMVSYDILLKGYEEVDAGFSIKMWYDESLPHWFNAFKSDFPSPKMNGLPLKVSIKDNDNSIDNFSFVTEVIEINPISIDEMHTAPPKQYEVVFIKDKDDLEKKKLFEKDAFVLDEISRDSILNIIKDVPNNYEGGSEFEFRWARVQKDGVSSYIDYQGDHQFDKILHIYKPSSDSKREDRYIDYRDIDSAVFIVKEKDKVGFIDSESGEWLLRAQYDAVDKSTFPLTKIYDGAKVGYVNDWGKVLLPAEFDEAISLDGENYFGVQKQNKWGVYSQKNNDLIIPIEYDKLDYCGGCGMKPNYIYAKSNEKWGIVNFENEVLVPFEYDFPAHGNMRSGNWVTNLEKQDKSLIINLSSKEVYIESEYEDMRIVNDFLALKKNGKFALVNSDGVHIIEYKYDTVNELYNQFYSGDYVEVKVGGKSGVIDKSGHVIIEPNKYHYISVSGDNEGFIVYDEDSKKMGLHSISGKKLLAAEFTKISSEHMEVQSKEKKNTLLFKVTQGDKIGWYNLSLEKLIDPQFADIRILFSKDSTNVYILAEKHVDNHAMNKEGLFNLDGRELLPAEYQDISFVSSSILRVKKGDKYGLFDLEAKEEILPAKFDNIITENRLGDFLRLVSVIDGLKDEQWWDLDSKAIIDIDYPEVSPSGTDDLWIVQDSSGCYLYEKKNDKIVSEAYEVIFPFVTDYALVYRDGKYGFIDETGEEIIPCVFDEASMDKSGYKTLSTREHGGLWKTIFTDSGRLALISKEFFSQSPPIPFSEDEEAPAVFKFKEYHKGRGKDLYGMISVLGEIIVQPNYERITSIAGGKAYIVNNDAFYGVVHSNGNVLVPTVLDRVFTNQHSSNWFQSEKEDITFPLIATIGSTYFYINEDGEILPLSFKEMIEFIN